MPRWPRAVRRVGAVGSAAPAAPRQSDGRGTARKAVWSRLFPLGVPGRSGPGLWPLRLLCQSGTWRLWQDEGRNLCVVIGRHPRRCFSLYLGSSRSVRLTADGPPWVSHSPDGATLNTETPREPLDAARIFASVGEVPYDWRIDSDDLVWGDNVADVLLIRGLR